MIETMDIIMICASIVAMSTTMLAILVAML